MLTLSKSMPVITTRALENNGYCELLNGDSSHDRMTTLLVTLLADETKQRKRFEDKLNKLESVVNKCDVDHLVDSLLHNVDDTNRQIYKTGVEFMKSTVSGILLSDK